MNAIALAFSHFLRCSALRKACSATAGTGPAASRLVFEAADDIYSDRARPLLPRFWLTVTVTVTVTKMAAETEYNCTLCYGQALAVL